MQRHYCQIRSCSQVSKVRISLYLLEGHDSKCEFCHYDCHECHSPEKDGQLWICLWFRITAAGYTLNGHQVAGVVLSCFPKICFICLVFLNTSEINNIKSIEIDSITLFIFNNKSKNLEIKNR